MYIYIYIYIYIIYVHIYIYINFKTFYCKCQSTPKKDIFLLSNSFMILKYYLINVFSDGIQIWRH